MLSCPEELPLKEDGTCTSCAEADETKPYWDPASEACTASCPEMVINGKCVLCTEADKSGTRPYWDSQSEECRSCADAFPDETKVWDPNMHKCVTQCPTGLVDEETGKCLSCYQANGDALPFWDEEAKVCTTCPPEVPNWDDEREVCAASCPAEAPAWVRAPMLKTYVCASCEVATDGRRRYWNPSAHECVGMC